MRLAAYPLSHGCRRASVSAAASVGRWATSHRDVAAPKGEPSLASPFGGRWCPVGTVQRSVSAAASVGAGRLPLADSTRGGRRECPPREGGEGTPLARRPAFGKPPSRCATVREKRFAVSLAFSHALRAYKGKAVGLWSHLPVRSAQGVCHRQTAPYNPQAF